MSSIPKHFYLLLLVTFMSCGNGTDQQNESEQAIANNASGTSVKDPQEGNGIVGEWEQQYTCFDKNSNYKLEPEEKLASGTRLGFDWFRFNSDGSCLRDKDMKFKGTYSVQEKSGTKKLLIESSDNLRYTIIELTDKELILGSDGAFIVFKRIK